LSGLVLTYEESRTNCIPIDSDLFPTVDWPYLRIWTREDSVDTIYRIRLMDYAEPIEGTYVPASAELELQGTITSGDYVGVSFLTEHYTYQVNGGDTLDSTVQQIVDSVNSFSTTVQASRTGSRIVLVFVGEGQSLETSTTGANGNRIGAYGFVSGAGTESWTPAAVRFSGGESPNKWRVSLDFSALVDIAAVAVPVTAVRKMRWTFSADLQDRAYQRSEFEVVVSGWTVTGTNIQYQIAGPGSRRIEDENSDIEYSGSWTRGIGNFSGGTIRHTTEAGAALAISYQCPLPHHLYLGTRYAGGGATIQVTVDSNVVASENLTITGEDVLVRLPLGSFTPGSHTVEATHVGTNGSAFYFDFLELAMPTISLPAFDEDPVVTLATDWDTDHSIAVAPERTAWFIHSLGFHGRANHYVGALWHYELTRLGHVYASATVDFIGTPVFSAITTIRIGRSDQPPESDAILSHLNRIGDTAQTLAKAFEMELNRGYTSVWAQASGTQLTICSRAMGVDGNLVTVGVSPVSGAFHLDASGLTLSGGVDGEWRTDVEASPRLNRAVRDWGRSFNLAMNGYGIDVAAAFSMELQHGDPSIEAGIAQRYPNGAPTWLNTPALQTNFSPASITFWKEIYREMAQLQHDAQQQPYVQFGEVQWWYFASDGSGMPFYDEYTLSRFQIEYGHPLAVIANHSVDPALYPDETEFLPKLIGEFTSAIITHVRATLPQCRFEVLYPTDVNDTAFNTLINYPHAEWTPSTLDCLKTESFTYTILRNLDRALGTVERPAALGFAQSQQSFLAGIGDSTTAWLKEVSFARAKGMESIVLLAVDQFCLIGYPVPLQPGTRRALYQG